MIFQSKFQGKIRIIGKEGVIASINQDILDQTQLRSHLIFKENKKRPNLPKLFPILATICTQPPQNNTEQNNTNLQGNIHPRNELTTSISTSNITNRLGKTKKRSKLSTISEFVNKVLTSNSGSRNSMKYIKLDRVGLNTRNEELKDKGVSEMRKYKINVNNCNKHKSANSPTKINSTFIINNEIVKAKKYSRQIFKLLHSSNPVANPQLDTKINFAKLKRIKQKFIQKIVNKN